MQDTLYLVDYFLDLAWAPLHGRWPVEEMRDLYQDVWAGWRLILDLRQMTGQAAADHVKKLPHHHLATGKEDSQKCAERTKEGIHAPASEEEWWDHFLLATPLPDGRRVPDLLEAGTDYSALIELVAASSR